MNETLVQTWLINARINVYVLDALTLEQYETTIAKGKAVNSHFSHMHSVRMMWLKSAAQNLLEGIDKRDGTACSVEEIRTALEQSAHAIAELISLAETPEGRIKGFKPHCSAFVSYLIAHESYHRAQLELGLRQAGLPLTDSLAYGTWEWGTK